MNLYYPYSSLEKERQAGQRSGEAIWAARQREIETQGRYAESQRGRGVPDGSYFSDVTPEMLASKYLARQAHEEELRQAYLEHGVDTFHPEMQPDPWPKPR